MITITEKAALKLNSILSEEQNCFFIIEVISGGCSGFRYEFSTGEIDSENFIILPHQKVAVHKTSMPFLEGAALDWDNSLMGSKPVIRNPMAVSGCGCGVSFSVD